MRVILLFEDFWDFACVVEKKGGIRSKDTKDIGKKSEEGKM